MSERLPILLLSGMAADERLFAAQLSRFPNLRVIPWIDPLPRESLRHYAARLATMIDPGEPCIIGGASFGGMVALEMSAHLETLACVLIGSICSPSELPWPWKLMRLFPFLSPDSLGRVANLASLLGRWFLSRGSCRRLARLARPESSFVRWAMWAVMKWRPSHQSRRARIFHIHGERDRVLPVKRTRPDEIVPNGGHALSLFSSSAVNDFLNRVEARV